jgi:halimadienyl-diphosphate synthase
MMLQRSSDKLQRLPLGLLYAGQSNLIHALEAFGPHLDHHRLRQVRAPDGSYGCSPSATAAVLIYGPEWDEAAAHWLWVVSERVIYGAKGGMPASHPADAFEAAWVAHLLMHGGIRLSPTAYPPLLHLLRWLRMCLSGEGASFARTRGLPCDADDTALVLAILNSSGVQSSLDPLWAFERGDHFVSYPGERVPSASANAHVLEALLSADSIGYSPLADRRDRIVRYLLDQRGHQGYWTDKWHLGPYYATLSCALALTLVPDQRVHAELAATSHWLLQAQQKDGGWGMAAPTEEETAYAVLTLCKLQSVLPETRTAVFRQAVLRGKRYLRRRLRGLHRSRGLPTLWVDKSVYTPVRVVRAAVLAALQATEW